MTDEERKWLEKEIQGLTARLKWDHVEETTKENWRQRLRELVARLED